MTKQAKVLVIDGQGGRLGALVIEGLRAAADFSAEVSIIAVGTNAAATAAMLKAGADVGATGSYPVVYHAPRAAVIIGPVGILAAGSLGGEITPEAAEAVALSDADKFLIPSERCTLHVVGPRLSLPEYAALAVRGAIEAL